MELGGKVTQKGGTIRGMRRAWNSTMRTLMWLISFHWHRDIRPKHFTHAGATEYGYTPRSHRYNMHKLRVKGHTYPLRWSDEAMDQTVANATISSTATSSGATGRVRMRAPHLNFRKRIDMRDELTRISVADIELSANVARVNLAKLRREAEATETVTIN